MLLSVSAVALSGLLEMRHIGDGDDFGPTLLVFIVAFRVLIGTVVLVLVSSCEHPSFRTPHAERPSFRTLVPNDGRSTAANAHGRTFGSGAIT